MNLRPIRWMIWAVMGCVLFWSGNVLAQISGDSQLRIQLRYSDGVPVTNEPVILQRLPEEVSITPDCTTDTNGVCAWNVGRGLYQVLFERPLDNISALAVAEGGLRGLGVTVGEENITYHFTFHSDGRVYFDAAHEAAIPSPIIPVGDVLHGGIQPTLTPTIRTDASMPERPTPELIDAPETGISQTKVPTSPSNLWRLLLFIGAGLVIGGGLHIWSQIKQKKNQSQISGFQSPVSGQEIAGQEESDA